MVWWKISDEQVRQASARIKAGEITRTVAQSYGMTQRGLRMRLVALDLYRGKRGRPKMVPLNHCRTCRCRVARDAAL